MTAGHNRRHRRRLRVNLRYPVLVFSSASPRFVQPMFHMRAMRLPKHRP
jgi:hypothetical protein